MPLKPSILNIAVGLFLIGIIIYTIFNYGQLSEGEGWGVVAMVGLFAVGIFLLVVDFIIQKIFKSRRTINIIGGVVTIIAILLLFVT